MGPTTAFFILIIRQSLTYGSHGSFFYFKYHVGAILVKPPFKLGPYLHWFLEFIAV